MEKSIHGSIEPSNLTEGAAFTISIPKKMESDESDTQKTNWTQYSLFFQRNPLLLQILVS